MLQLSFFESKEIHMVIIFLPTEDDGGICKFDRKEMTKEEILNIFKLAEKVTRSTYTLSAHHKDGKEYLIRLGNCKTRKNDNITSFIERCWEE